MLDHFSPPLLAQKCWFRDLRFYSTYSRSSRRCEVLEIGTINDFLIKAKQINLEQAYLGINKVK